jgi:hypothetical protein
MTIAATAEAFSRHAFRDTYPYMAEDVRWDLVGAAPLEGRVAVVAACEGSADQLRAVQTHFTAFRVRNGTDFVVVDSTADYVHGDGVVSRVASCDLYTFTGDVLTEIISYNVELSS